MLYQVWVGFELTILVVIGTDCIGSCKSNHDDTCWFMCRKIRYIFLTVQINRNFSIIATSTKQQNHVIPPVLFKVQLQRSKISAIAIIVCDWLIQTHWHFIVLTFLNLKCFGSTYKYVTVILHDSCNQNLSFNSLCKS